MLCLVILLCQFNEVTDNLYDFRFVGVTPKPFRFYATREFFPELCKSIEFVGLQQWHREFHLLTTA